MLGDHWRHPGQSGLATPPLDGDQSVLEADTEWADELHDDDSDADDSVRSGRHARGVGRMAGEGEDGHPAEALDAGWVATDRSHAPTLFWKYCGKTLDGCLSS